MTQRTRTRVLILGVSGMLGSALFRDLSMDPGLETYGTVRDSSALKYFPEARHQALIPNVHLEGETGLLTALTISQPAIVINCIGIIKQVPSANDHLESLAINATLPHRLSKYCDSIGARLIHFSTDCVFSGRQGQYKEDDFADAYDLYGRTKYLGEVDYGNALTLRTSIIGHELNSQKSLVDWFLGQTGSINGFKNAIFSGLPTIEVARVMRELVIPNDDLSGLYHLSVNPINKYDLLALVAEVYDKNIEIVPKEEPRIDRSLNSDKFRDCTGFEPRGWRSLIEDMQKYHRRFFA